MGDGPGACGLGPRTDGDRTWLIQRLDDLGGVHVDVNDSGVPGEPGKIPRDPGHLTVLLAYLAVMFVVCLLACLVPARRAMAVNPIDALRAE